MKKLFTILLSFLIVQAATAQPTRRYQNDPFLDSLSLHTFRFFWDLGNTDNAQIPDRWPTDNFSSIAATGFGLTSYVVGVEKGYITRKQAAERVLRTLRVLNELPKGPQMTDVSGYKGFFYHFLVQKTGLRFQNVELSTIDTGLLMAGILVCMTYFDAEDGQEKAIRELADKLYREVEWDWAMNGQKTMSMGWFPDKGFLDASWRGYNEAMVLLVMAMGSPTHPIGAEAWDAWTASYQWKKHQGMEYVNFGPLFGHQYSHCYIDFRGIQDKYMRAKGIDYFENSRRATLANWKHCVQNPGGFDEYGEKMWGLTACDGPGNKDKWDPNTHFMDYSARGVGYTYLEDDGTIAPTAAGGSIPFAPKICIEALRNMKEKYPRTYRKYGFIDAFNFSFLYENGDKGWYDIDQLGIDQGPILIQLANYQDDTVWKILRKNPYIVSGLKKAGFTGGWLGN